MDDAWIFTLASVFFVSLLSLVGVLFFFLGEKTVRKGLLFLVSFSAGALLGDAFIHLLPEAVEDGGFTLYVSLSLMSGILAFFVMEKFIHWHHCHDGRCEKHPHSLAFMNLIGDGVHNFIDGLVIAGSYLVSVPLGIATTIAVVFHEIPQEIGDFGVLIHSGFKKGKALFFNFVSALMAVVGALLALVLGSAGGGFLAFIVPFTAGGFIYIGAADLIPELHKENSTWRSLGLLMVFVLGIAVMVALTFLE